MRKFEYKTVKIEADILFWKDPSFDTDSLDASLNVLGAEGWELVTVQGATNEGTSWFFLYTFKREI